MEKYRGLCKDGRVFPVPPYRSCLRSLKKDWERNVVSPSRFPGNEPSFVRNLGLPLQRSSIETVEFNAWSQEHKDNPGVCQDYQRKKLSKDVEKVVSANK